MAILLLSDDSLTVQRLIAMTFAGHDVQVTAVGDGEAAIARMKQQRPDIVLASIGTPGRTGYEVAAYMKSTPELAGTPVLLLAAAFEPVDEVRVAQVRCDGVLVKPLDPRQVVARVKQLLQSIQATPGAALAQAAIPAPAQAASAPAGTVDDYFERLDAAFAQRPALRSMTTSDDLGTVPTLDGVLQPDAPATPATPARPPGPLASPAAAPLVTDALIDEVTRRVAERLGTAAIRDVIADVVADVAERLIREEIARIRNKT